MKIGDNAHEAVQNIKIMGELRSARERTEISVNKCDR